MGSQSKTKSSQTSDISTQQSFDQSLSKKYCEYEDQKPTELLEYFADGNGGIAKIKWSSWSSEGAQGTGLYFRNNCEPDCASGKFSYTDVAVYLDSPVKAKGRVHLTALSYEEVDKTGQVVDGGISGGWDVSEMYRMMRA